MRPPFCCEVEIGGVMPLSALERLARAGIRAYCVRKVSVCRLKLYVRAKEMQKVFAILRGSCYTVTNKGSVGCKRLADALLARPGLWIGALLLAAALWAGGAAVLRIEVEGSAARNAARVREVLQEAGIAPFTFYREEEGEAVRTALLALPGVVFASVEKSGCVLTITVEESAEPPAPVRKQSLVAPRAGVVEELTVLRGTAEVSVGEAVSAGQTLVGGYFVQGEERHETFAIARCALLCSFQGEYAFAAESEAARESALAQALLAAGGELTAQEISVRAEGEGVVYAVRLTVRVRLSAGL